MEEKRVEKNVKSAFDSTTFNADIKFHVQKELNDIGSATISPSGRDVAIASKSGLEIIDLDSPLNPPRHLRHGQSWLVADVQWSPFAVREYWVASASNQKALIWNLNLSDDSKNGAIDHTLHAHTRAITDINFSAHHPDVLSTCSVDGFVHCWDLRRPRRPVMSFCEWNSGATQVKWNRQNSHIIASSHGRFLHIWDDRKGAEPLRSIKAHDSKIYGVDWNRTRATGIATCSLDRSIKFWDYGNEGNDPERVIRTDFPVWRARHTPFGWGVLAMPQNSPGTLHLYDRRKTDIVDEYTPAVAKFPSHGEKQVKEFLWRTRGGVTETGIDNREFQLVSWGTDQQLRLQPVDAKALEAVGYVKGSQVRKNLNVTRRGATYKSFRDVEKSEGEKEKEKEKTSRPYSVEGQQSGNLSDSIKKMTLSKHPRPKEAQSYITWDRKSIESRETGKKNQIGWMSGIKFSKTEAGDAARQRGLVDRRLSLIHPNFEADEEWNAPETLHDEIIRVHKQYSKVTFDDVNMDKRSVKFSMNGPWGEGGESVYLKVSVSFPDQYPESKLPEFLIGKSSLISEAVSQKISNEIQQIAAGFVGRKRGCLEAAICYLLGEVDLEESTIWFTAVQNAEDVDALADESSSEDDSDMPAGTSAMMSQELDTSVPDGMLAPLERHANVPLPRKCGAVFTTNGKLVCFFPPKEEKVKSLLGTVNLEKERPKGEASFNSFSRLKHDLTASKSNFSSSLVEEYDGETSDSSERSSSSSSSGSDSSQFRVGVTYDFFRKRPGATYRRALSTNRSQKSSTVGTGTGTGVSKGRQPKPKNTISIYSMDNLVPARKDLAKEYAIFGDGAEVCNHNAKIADSYGKRDYGDIWRYAALLLQHEVPLEVLDQSHRQEPILVIAQTMIKRCRRDSGSDSGIDVSFDQRSKPDKFCGRVKWGHSPLAKYLIDDLFDHFEKLADIQMLAMLSCVFSEPSTEDGVSHAEMRLRQPETPLSMKTPGFSLDYFPTDAAAWSAYQRTPFESTGSTPKALLTPNGYYGSLGSSNGIWSSDPASGTYSCGDTPPMKSNRIGPEKIQQSQSLSTSPEDNRSFRRANSGLGQFAASFTRPFSATAPSSPPSRKRPSPVEGVHGTLTPTSITWGHNTIMESVKERSYQGRTSYSDEDSTLDEFKSSIVTGVSVVMHNQSHFDDEGHISTPLLSPSHSSLFTHYRRAYASLLFSWGLQFQRLEILKFNGLPDYFTETSNIINQASVVSNPNFAASVASTDANTIRDGPPSPHLLKKYDSVVMPDGKGLDIAGYCLKHESRLSPVSTAGDETTATGGATGRCDRCVLVKRQLSCVICAEPVTTMYAPCLSCGCVTHQGCLGAYLAADDSDEEIDELINDPAELDEDGELAQSTGNITIIGAGASRSGEDVKRGKKCPGGCECTCVFDAGKGAVEDWDVMIGLVERARKLPDTGYVAAESDIDNNSVYSTDYEREIGEWESVDGPTAFASLASHSGYSGPSTAYGNRGHGIPGGPAIVNSSGGVARGGPKLNPAMGFSPPPTGSTSGSQSLSYSHLGRRLGQVRSGDWGIGSGLRKKGGTGGSGLRKGGGMM